MLIENAAEADVPELVTLVNRVYADAERGLWQHGVARTDAGEIRTAVKAGELLVARLDNRVAGAVRVRRLSGELGEFGMLAVDPATRGAGLGRRLIDHAEQWARGAGLSRMQLELLVPRDWPHPQKEYLRAWYTRLGYSVVRHGRLDEAYPALVPLLATPSTFLVFHKPLGGADWGRPGRP